MSKEIIHEDIFEAIRHLEQNNQILRIKDNNETMKLNDFQYEIMEMNDNSCIILPNFMQFNYYRGEPSDLYPECFATIYRNNKKYDNTIDEDGIIIDMLKLIEFEEIIKTFPQVKSALKHKIRVNFEAIAQHYGLNTRMVDFTQDIIVASFFATHTFSNTKNGYEIVENGIGQIHRCSSLTGNFDMGIIGLSEDFKQELFGVQPFLRPQKQCALGMSSPKKYDFNKIGTTIKFKQNKHMNRKLNELFYPIGGNINILFPPEEYEIDKIANIVKNDSPLLREKILTMRSIDIYCERFCIKKEIVENILKERHYSIILDEMYVLSEELSQFQEKQFINLGFQCSIQSGLYYKPPQTLN